MISLLFGLFLGLAVLAKGPAALVLLGGAVFFWAVFTKRWRDAFRLVHPAALAAFFLTALPWYVLCERRNPDFFRVFVIEHNFKRYLTHEFQHIQPFWYYAAVLLIALLPWTALFLWSLISGGIRLWRTRSLSDATLLFLSWSAFCLLFFSLSKSKLPGYILPTVPAITLLMTHSQSVLTPLARKWLSLATLGAALFFAACFALTESVATHVSQGNINLGIAVGLVFGVLSAASLLLGVGLRSGGKTPSILAGCCVLPVLFAVTAIDRCLPSLFYWDPSGRTIARELQRIRIPTEVLSVKTMSRAQRYSLSFYLRREIPEWDRDHPHDGYLLAGGKYCKGVVVENFTCDEIPFDLQKTGFFLYRLRTRLVNSSARSGQAQ